jgi:uncharacterized protein (TIGR02284 family)
VTEDYAVEVLNGLVETSLDSAQGYDKAEGLARNPRFRTLFQERAEARRRLTRELKEEVSRLGGQAPGGGSILGQAHRWFAQARDRFAGHSDKALIEEVERGERYVQGRFQKAADDSALPAPVRQLIGQALQTIAADLANTSAIQNEFP